MQGTCKIFCKDKLYDIVGKDVLFGDLLLMLIWQTENITSLPNTVFRLQNKDFF